MNESQRLIMQQTLLTSGLTFSEPELTGIQVEVDKALEQNPARPFYEIVSEQIQKVKKSRLSSNDTSEVEKELRELSQKAKELSQDAIGNRFEMQNVLKKIDNLEKKLGR